MDDNPIGFGVGFDGKPHITIDMPGPVDLAIGYDGNVSPALDGGPVDMVLSSGSEPNSSYSTTRAHDWEHKEPRRGMRLETIMGLAVGAAAAYLTDRYLGSEFTTTLLNGIGEPDYFRYAQRGIVDLVLGGTVGGLAAIATHYRPGR